MKAHKAATAILAGSLALGLVMASLFPVIASAGSIPQSASISGIAGHAQTFSLSCEARSAADWAAFWGVKFSEAGFLRGIPSSDNPDRGFVGDLNDAWGYIPPHSYGVYARPVAARLKEYGLNAVARRGLQWDDLRGEIAAGRPVIVWVIGQMWNGTPVSYTPSDGNKTIVAHFEHTMILIGYDARTVHVVDAYSGMTQSYALSTFLTSWAVLGDMAIFGSGRLSPTQASAKPTRSPKTTPTAPKASPVNWPYKIVLPVILSNGVGDKPVETPVPTAAKKKKPETYTVQRGDFLIDLGDRLGVDWRVLADLNELDYPWVIFPGQVLKLPAR
jgi:uncharacterized protein YvpB